METTDEWREQMLLAMRRGGIRQADLAQYITEKTGRRLHQGEISAILNGRVTVHRAIGAISRALGIPLPSEIAAAARRQSIHRTLLDEWLDVGRALLDQEPELFHQVLDDARRRLDGDES